MLGSLKGDVVFSVICCGSVPQFAGNVGNGTTREKTLLSHVRGRSRERSKVTKLEAELGGQLNAARASAAQERVADADVAGGGDLVSPDAGFARV